jgi:hypothetical protein
MSGSLGSLEKLREKLPPFVPPMLVMATGFFLTYALGWVILNVFSE